MTHNVIDLDTRRTPPKAAPNCCARHDLDDLAASIRRRLDATDGLLLIPRSDLEGALHDLEATTDRLLPIHTTQEVR